MSQLTGALIMWRNFLTAGYVVLISGSLALAGGGRQFVAVSQLPPAVLNAANKASNDVEWLGAFKCVEFFRGADTTWYGLSGAPRTQKRLVRTMVLESGEVIEVRFSIPLEELPEVATSALKRQLPAFKAQSAEAVGKSMKATIYYLLDGELNGSKCTVSVTANGSLVKKRDP
jgi:hypothetical protein